MSIKTRKKASDIYRESNYVFAKKVPFEQAFPQIEDLRVEIEESLYGSKKQAARYEKDGLEEYFDCSNILCHGGGISIGGIIRKMVQKNETHFEDIDICVGHEASPKGRRIYRKCMHSFKVVIDIKYRSAM